MFSKLFGRKKSATIVSFEQKSKRVEHILKAHPETRNNDNLLIKLYWETFDNVHKIDDIVFATPPEVIRRARQKFNQKEMYLPTDPDVLRKRRKAALEMTQIQHV